MRFSMGKKNVFISRKLIFTLQGITGKGIVQNHDVKGSLTFLETLVGGLGESISVVV